MRLFDVDISIIMITYNHGKYIRKAIDSVFNQQFLGTYEIIIGDDCSIDNTVEFLKTLQIDYPDIVKLFLRSSNIGPTRNFYETLKQANGRYIAILEGDDYWIDTCKLQKEMELLDSHHEYIGCASKIFKVDEDGVPLKVRYVSDKKFDKKFAMNDFLAGKTNSLFQSSSLFFRNIFHASSKIDFSIVYTAHRIIGDGTIISVLLNQGDLFIYKEQMTAYRVRRSKTSDNAVSILTQKPLQYLQSVFIYADRLEEYFQYKYDFYSFRKQAMKFAFRYKRQFSKDELMIFYKIIGEFKKSQIILVRLEDYWSSFRRMILFLPKKMLKWNNF